ncbi:hypothetical protein [Streptomyces radiopugnans]|uniref:Gram-positive cocci surface proteins LPxTG domain-containing protein n=1 Tax=Streptomyces radiopugnans TaxID=403935 RepID=A0A1H9C9R8_9ACTN|nr:hypothetical protein [Streptomyces radiopugnans]SEP97980.1 hypothetical protein SAMN05216481_103118 [Streptomyces radiopugnans]
MREAAITLLACVMVLVPAPVALASQQSAVVTAVPGGAKDGVEPGSEDRGKPSSSPTASPDDPEESEDPDDPREPDDPEETERPPRLTLPPWPPGGSSPDPDPTPTPTPTPDPTSGEPSGEPSGTAPDGEGDGGRGPGDAGSAEPPGTSRQTPQGRTEQVSDRRTGTGDHYDDYVYDDGRSGEERAQSRATPATGGQLLPVLPLGAGLTFLGLGLASLALRLRR